MKAQLVLENGKRFMGEMFGYERETSGEIIFTTGMTGYQEIITDPSYAGQMVVMTFPLIGNYGINFEDMVSDRAGMRALIVRDKCDYPSNFRSEMTLDDFMKQHGVVGIRGIDTRELTKIIRDNGCMKGVIAKIDTPQDKIDALMAEEIKITDFSVKEKTVLNKNAKKHIAFIDMGVKDTVLKYLQDNDYKITVFPSDTTADEILKDNPQLLFVSNGPGNPKDYKDTIETVKNIIGKMPVTGISLGHQIIALALGAKSEKLKYGHHGANQPVKNLSDGTVFVTVQNHNFIVTDVPSDVEVTYVNVNDSSVEGLRHKTLEVESMQFDPQTAPRPLNLGCLFDKFLKEVR